MAEQQSEFRGASTSSASPTFAQPVGDRARAEEEARQEAARQEERRLEGAEARADGEPPPPVTPGNAHLLIGSDVNKQILDQKNATTVVEPQVLTADEMILVNRVKVGTFTEAEIESASLKAYDPAEKPLNPPGIPATTGGMAGERDGIGGGVVTKTSSVDSSVSSSTGDAGQVERLQNLAREQATDDGPTTHRETTGVDTERREA